ncbi:MAG: hypothetical protein ACOZQL_09690 [Myxococcota bacterium]
MERKLALERLRALGFQGPDVYFAELVPAVEMAWADGVVQPNEQAVLEAYAQTLVDALNEQAGANLFTLARALAWLSRLTRRRLSPHERGWALESVRLLSAGPQGTKLRKRVVEWCEAVAAVDGSPVWDARELFWLQRVRTALELV